MHGKKIKLPDIGRPEILLIDIEPPDTGLPTTDTGLPGEVPRDLPSIRKEENPLKDPLKGPLKDPMIYQTRSVLAIERQVTTRRDIRGVLLGVQLPH